MPRPTRVAIPGVSVHLFQRGHNRAPVFADAADFEWFLAFVEVASSAQGFAVHGYALMTNHYHILGTPRDAAATSRFVHQSISRYGHYYNRRHQRSGTLWGGRFRSVLIDDAQYWLTCLRYIEQNPVRANMVARAADYQWSSYRVHALGAPTEWLVPHPIYLGLGGSDRKRREAYESLCNASLDERELARQRLGARHVPGTCLAPE